MFGGFFRSKNKIETPLLSELSRSSRDLVHYTLHCGRNLGTIGLTPSKVAYEIASLHHPQSPDVETADVGRGWRMLDTYLCGF